MEEFTNRVDLQKIITENGLKVLYTPEDPSKIMIASSDVNRPGLVLAGFFEHFDPKRIEIIGNAESMYIKQMPEELRRERLTDFFKHHPIAVVVTHGNEVDPMELSVRTILELTEGPELQHKGVWAAWFGGVFVCAVTAFSILFADELFRWDLSFRVRDVEQAEPSDWEIASRYIGWTVCLILALGIFIKGLGVV